MQYKKEISEYIDAHRSEIIDDIRRICAVNSERMPAKEGMPFGEGPYEALKLFQKIAEEKGFSMKIHGNAVGSIDLSDKPRELDMLAHLDVVPAGEGWVKTQPFTVLEEDGKLYGRGTADDKGPAVVLLWALRCVRDLGIELNKSARVVVGTDEECGSSDLPYYYREENEPPMSFTADASFPVINTEKGRFTPVFRSSWNAPEKLPCVKSMKGSLKVNVLPGKAHACIAGLDADTLSELSKPVSEATGAKFTFQKEGDAVRVVCEGEGAHAASPQKGNNALTALIAFLCEIPFAPHPNVQILHELKKLFPHGDHYGKGLGVDMSDPVSGPTTLVLSMLEWDEEGFWGQYDSRCSLNATEENTRQAAIRRLTEAGMSVDDSPLEKPHHVPEDSKLVASLNHIYETYTGEKGGAVAIGGGTYVHHLQNGVAFGCSMPGTDNRMHGADEFAVIEELMISAKMFAQAIALLCE